jgi:hypothetical protein
LARDAYAIIFLSEQSNMECSSGVSLPCDHFNLLLTLGWISMQVSKAVQEPVGDEASVCYILEEFGAYQSYQQEETLLYPGN